MNFLQVGGAVNCAWLSPISTAKAPGMKRNGKMFQLARALLPRCAFAVQAALTGGRLVVWGRRIFHPQAEQFPRALALPVD